MYFTMKKFRIYGSKSGKLLYEVEKMTDKWIIFWFEGKSEKDKFLTDEDMSSMQRNRRYSFDECLYF